MTKTLTPHETLLHKLAFTWRSRATALGLKPGTKKFAEGQLHYFVGASAALEAVAPEAGLNPGILLCLVCGRDSAEFIQEGLS